MNNHQIETIMDQILQRFSQKTLGKQKLDQEKLTKLLENIKSSSNELV